MNDQLKLLYGGYKPEEFGAFIIPYKGNDLRIFASNYSKWDHISISLKHRCPDWYEMEYVAKMFFRPHEVAIQYHMPEKRHINFHPNVLHWWRPHHPKIILIPPPTMV